MLDYSSACGSPPCPYYYHADWHGSTVMLSNAAGQESASYRYGPYGENIGDSWTGNPFRYTGRRLDAETGLYYYRDRYYSTTLGRFLQTDPIGGKDDLNLYAYTHGDPLNDTDPTGQAMCSVNGGDSTDCENVQLSSIKATDSVTVTLDSGASFDVSGTAATAFTFIPVVGALPALQDLHAAGENGDIPGMAMAAGEAVLGMVAGKEGQVEGKALASGAKKQLANSKISLKKPESYILRRLGKLKNITFNQNI